MTTMKQPTEGYKPVVTNGNNSYYDLCSTIFKVATAVSGSKGTNKSRIKGNRNTVMLDGKGNDSDINGDKNLVAERGVDNKNVTKGKRNKVGQNGNKNLNDPNKSTDDTVVFQDSGADAGKTEKQTREIKEKNIARLHKGVF